MSHRPQRPADRRVPVVGPGRPVGEHHRLRGAHHAQADRARRVDAGREEPDPEPGQGDAGAARRGCSSWSRTARAAELSEARQGPGRRRRALARRSARTTSRRTGSPTTASGSRSTSSTRCWPASSTRSATPSSHDEQTRRCRARDRARPDRRSGWPTRPPRDGLLAQASWRGGTSWPMRSSDWGSRGRVARGGRSAHGRGGVRLRRCSVPAAARRRGVEDGAARFAELVTRRLTGEPLQYVLGRWGFRTLDLLVDRRVLILGPRPSRSSKRRWSSSTG